MTAGEAFMWAAVVAGCIVILALGVSLAWIIVGGVVQSTREQLAKREAAEKSNLERVPGTSLVRVKNAKRPAPRPADSGPIPPPPPSRPRFGECS